MNQDSIPFYKSPFLKEEIHTILKSLLDDGSFSSSYSSLLEEKISQAKGSHNSFTFTSFPLAFSLALDILGLKSGDTLAVSELFTAELAKIVSDKEIQLLYIPCNLDTLSMNIEALKSIEQKVTAIYLEYPIAYNSNLYEFLEMDSFVLLNDSSYWGLESFLHKEIGNLSQEYKNKLMGISSMREGDFIHLGGEGAILHSYSSKITEICQTYNLLYYQPTPISCLIGVVQVDKIVNYLSNYKAIWDTYSNTLKVNYQDLYYSIKVLLINNNNNLLLKSLFKSKNIQVKSMNSEDYALGIEKRTAGINYFIENSLYLPIYPTLPKKDLNQILYYLQKIL